MFITPLYRVPDADPAAAPDNTGEPTWLEGFPEGMRESLGKFSDNEALGTAYLNAEKLIGRDKIPMPQTPDEFMDVRRRLGAPENIEDYKFKDVEMPEGVRTDDGIVGSFKDIALSQGLSLEQADAVYAWYMGESINAHNTSTAFNTKERETQTQDLRTDWGEGYDKQMVIANRAIKELGGEDFQKFVETSGMKDNPTFLKAFARIGSKMMEDSLLDAKSLPGGRTPGEIDAEIANAMADPAYTNGEAVNHMAAVVKVQKLMEQKHNV